MLCTQSYLRLVHPISTVCLYLCLTQYVWTYIWFLVVGFCSFWKKAYILILVFFMCRYMGACACAMRMHRIRAIFSGFICSHFVILLNITPLKSQSKSRQYFLLSRFSTRTHVRARSCSPIISIKILSARALDINEVHTRHFCISYLSN